MTTPAHDTVMPPKLPLPFRLSEGLLTTISPPIPLAYEWASRYRATPAQPLLDMSQGAPAIPPPPFVQKALGEAASSPASFGYSYLDGELAMREALVEEMKVVYRPQSDVRMDDVAMTAGCNLAFSVVAMSLLDPGDEVIVPVPWYFDQQMTINLLGGKAVPLLCSPELGFSPSVEQCRDLVTPKTKAISLVTPNNPTGAIYSPELLAAFAALSAEKNIVLIVDETYRDFLVSDKPPHTLFSSPSWRNHLIHLFSFSKSYCLPGHRLGAIAASPILLARIKSVLDAFQICPPRPIQIALAQLLPRLRPFLKQNAMDIHERHKLFKACLPEGWTIGAQGGYFAFVRHPFVKVKARDVGRRLAEEAGLIVLPSTFFRIDTPEDLTNEGERDADWARIEEEEQVAEQERWLRFSVASADDTKVKQVCERLLAVQKSFLWETE